MILDTSVIIAVMNNEPERETALNLLENADALKIAAGTLMETALIVTARFGEDGLGQLERLLDKAGCECVPSTRSHVEIVTRILARYGKGRDNKAQLNYGDCFAYALAAETGETLLFKGGDFIHTDLKLMRLGA